jgi:hypothetical protein
MGKFIFRRLSQLAAPAKKGEPQMRRSTIAAATVAASFGIGAIVLAVSNW